MHLFVALQATIDTATTTTTTICKGHSRMDGSHKSTILRPEAWQAQPPKNQLRYFRFRGTFQESINCAHVREHYVLPRCYRSEICGKYY